MKKNCKQCKKEFSKRVTCSKKEWAITKCCSKICAHKSLIGRKVSPERLEQMKKETKARYLSGEKFGIQKGDIPWCKGTKGIMKPNQTSFYKGQPAWNKGKSATWVTGEKNNFWKGGVTPLNIKIRGSIENRLWREGVFACDYFTCRKCGDSRGNNLNAHHIQNFSKYPELRFALDNGITFCTKCHNSFHKKYGTRNNTREQLTEFLQTT